MLRAVLDPGVLIAALLSRKGAPARLLLAWRAGAFELIVCPRLLAELARVLARDKFRAYLSRDDAEVFVAMLRQSALLVPDPSVVEPLTPDPGDDYLVALAREARAQVLVSGDRHLTGLRLAPLILTPREFARRLKPDGT